MEEIEASRVFPDSSHQEERKRRGDLSRFSSSDKRHQIRNTTNNMPPRGNSRFVAFPARCDTTLAAGAEEIADVLLLVAVGRSTVCASMKCDMLRCELEMPIVMSVCLSRKVGTERDVRTLHFKARETMPFRCHGP